MLVVNDIALFFGYQCFDIYCSPTGDCGDGVIHAIYGIEHMTAETTLGKKQYILLMLARCQHRQKTDNIDEYHPTYLSADLIEVYTLNHFNCKGNCSRTILVI